jgi:hypothetical protein
MSWIGDLQIKLLEEVARPKSGTQITPGLTKAHKIHEERKQSEEQRKRCKGERNGRASSRMATRGDRTNLLAANHQRRWREADIPIREHSRMENSNLPDRAQHDSS